MKRGSLTKPIPLVMREQLSQDLYMRDCKVGGDCEDRAVWNDCEGRIEWNHSMTYKGSRVNELYFLIPVCSKHHRQIAKYQDIMRREIVARIKHFGAEEEFRKKYPRSTLKV